MSLNYIPRVTQLDAGFLDEQFEDLIKQSLYQATNFLDPGTLQPYLPEIELLIRTFIFKYSVWEKKSSFGQQMLSLNYKPENFTRSKLMWYYGYMIGLKYLKERSLYSFTANRKVQNFFSMLETFQVFADVMNLLRFIQNGKHPLFIDFILGLEVTAEKLTRENLTDFSWTRELLWNNFIELIGTAISLMNIFGLRNKLTKIMRYMWWRKYVPKSGNISAPKMDISTVCASCSSPPVIPHTMGCSHIFCYYCLKANKMADENYQCPKCYYNGLEVLQYCVT